ncbi:MAG: DUF4923 family protein, partial [Alistipes sp.]|nr:DUF4923 family protein [Alistipes sp.]
MKKLILLIAFFATMFSAQRADAQSLGDLFNGLSKLLGSSTESQQQVVKPVYPSAEELLGTWVYSAPEMIYTGNDALASIAVSSVKGQIPALANKFGIVPGTINATVNKKSIKAWRGEQKSTATYTYIPSTGQFTASTSFRTKRASLPATSAKKNWQKPSRIPMLTP